MKRILKWAALVVAMLVVAFAVALPFFMRAANVGIGRRGFHPGGMMGAYGFQGMMGLTWLGGAFMLLRLVVPLVVLALVVVGVVALVRGLRKPAALPETHPCVKCGKPLQPGWLNCPFCGEKTTEE